MKNKDTQKYMIILVVAMLLVGGGMFFALGGGSASTIDKGIVDPETGLTTGPWANTLVNYNLIVSDEYTGADVSASVKVYDEKPEDWGNPRGDFDEAKDYTIYTSSNGIISINKEMPGKYYAVLSATGYNTEFVELTIPDGSNRGDISEYQSNPDSKVVEFALIGETTEEDFDFALTNDSSAELKDTVLLTLKDNTELRGWKVIVNDENGFSLDSDGDGIYDEGISRFKISVNGKSYTIFDPDKGVDEFDSNDEYTFNLDSLTVSDGEDLVIKVEIDAITGDFTGANDETLGEGEGVISYIKIYDMEGNLFTTTDVTC